MVAMAGSDMRDERLTTGCGCMQVKTRSDFYCAGVRILVAGLSMVAVTVCGTGCAITPKITYYNDRQPAPASSRDGGGNAANKSVSAGQSLARKPVAPAPHTSTARNPVAHSLESPASILLTEAKLNANEPELVDPIQTVPPPPLPGSNVPPAPGSDDETGDANGVGNRMTLEELEGIALANNPAIQELVATTQKAAGYRTQVSVRPNPSVGYQGQQLADNHTDQHLAFMEREFVTAGKRQLNRRVLNAALAAQLQELEAQRLRVTTDIRIRFYQALAFQRQLELINEFSAVAEKGLRIAQLRREAGEGSQVDVLQATILKNEITLTQQQTSARLAAIWREISALAGVPNLPYATLEGTLPTLTPPRDWQQLSATLVQSSPEFAAAQVRITRACANLERQLKQPIPNLAVQLGAGVDYGAQSGMLNVQVGVPVPVSNANQGNIAAARAEIRRAHMDAQRIRNDIEARLAVVSREYDTAVAAVNQYSSNILPSAVSSMDLAEQAYQAGEAEFVQLLIARRTYFESNLKYVSAQSDLAGAQAQIDGFLLTGALNSVRDESGDDSLRGQTFSQQ